MAVDQAGLVIVPVGQGIGQVGELTQETFRHSGTAGGQL